MYLRFVRSLQSFSVALLTPLAVSIVAIPLGMSFFYQMGTFALFALLTLFIIVDEELVEDRTRPVTLISVVISYILTLLGFGLHLFHWVISGETIIIVGTFYGILVIEVSLRPMLEKHLSRIENRGPRLVT